MVLTGSFHDVLIRAKPTAAARKSVGTECIFATDRWQLRTPIGAAVQDCISRRLHSFSSLLSQTFSRNVLPTPRIRGRSQTLVGTRSIAMIQRRSLSTKSRQRGQGMSEYIIITALVAVAGIGLFAAFGDVLQNQMAGMSKEMAGQSGGTNITAAGTSATTAQTRAAQADNLSNYNQQTNSGGGAGGGG
jgi:pilus assembly protein Flp/PilA